MFGSHKQAIVRDNVTDKFGLRRPLTLIKFLRSEHVADFIAGRLRMGSAKSFREDYQEELSFRNDNSELLSDHHQPNFVVITINGHQIGKVCSPLKVRRCLDHRTYLFCMTAITDSYMEAGNGVQQLPGDLIHLGDKAVLVTDLNAFANRIDEAINEAAHLYAYPDTNEQVTGLVEYVDFETYHGPVGPFRKSQDYAFQMEWRMAFVDGRDDVEDYPDHIWLNVGDLSDIVFVADTAKLVGAPIKVRRN